MPLYDATPQLTNQPAIEDTRQVLAEQLCRAAKHGHVREVEALIDIEEVSPNVQNSDGLTPLMLACVRDGHDPLMGTDTSEPQRLEVAQLLLDRQADINAAGPGDWTPIFYASFYCNESILRLLLESKADVHHLDEAARGAPSWARYGDCDRDHLRLMTKLFTAHGYHQHVEVLVKKGEVQSAFHCPIMLDEEAKAILTRNVPKSTNTPSKGGAGGRKKKGSSPSDAASTSGRLMAEAAESQDPKKVTPTAAVQNVLAVIKSEEEEEESGESKSSRGGSGD